MLYIQLPPGCLELTHSDIIVSVSGHIVLYDKPKHSLISGVLSCRNQNTIMRSRGQK